MNSYISIALLPLKEQAKKFPLTSGVYRFLDKNNEVLYIGRATSLRRRVLQYFRKDIDPRIKEMVRMAKEVKFQTTDSVLEAIVLEANLIKKFWPKYNIIDKDHRSFSYLVIPKTDYPKPFISRGRELEKITPSVANIFGPYLNVSLLKKSLKLARRIFPYGICQPNSGKACFDYQIGLCPGICIGAIALSEYKKNVRNLVLFFQGKKKKLKKELAKENPLALKALEHVQDVALLLDDKFSARLGEFSRVEGYDISHFGGKDAYGSMVVFKNGESDKSQYRLFKIKNSQASDDLAALGEIVSRRFKHVEWPRPDVILLDGGRPQVASVIKILKYYNIAVPVVGISKLGGDKLVFASDSTKSFRELAEAAKKMLQQVRDEAHRFANRGRKHAKLSKFSKLTEFSK